MYRGIQMRSRLEARTAGWLDRYKIPWSYEPGAFADENGDYLPDFIIKDFGVAGRTRRPLYVEVKPTWKHADAWKTRMFTIWSSQPHADLLMLAPGYLDFAFGDYYPGECDPHDGRPAWMAWPRSIHTWIADWGMWRPNTSELPAEAGQFHRCTECHQATLTIAIDCFACARCGSWDGDHFLGPLDPANPEATLPIPLEQLHRR
jgi:hypothetical protein